MNKATDFENELERIDKDLSELKDGTLNNAAATNGEKVTGLAYRLYQRATLTGNLNELTDAETAIKSAIGQLSNPVDLYYLKANLDFTLHRVMDARRDLLIVPGLCDSLQGRALLADLDFQEGRYEEARSGYEAIIRDDRTWDNLARLAYFKSKMGDTAGAEQLYIEAVDEITAKQMRSYAWVELQRGLLDLTHGHYEGARVHYERAGRAYTGYWLVDEHMAELLGALGRFDEAVALYEKVIARVPRPEFQQALGELYVFMGQPEQAESWFEGALAAYLASASRGDVHYYHHLADFYADVREDGQEALKWARKDAALRNNFSTQAALAWALYRNGQLDEALEQMNQALSSGVRDAHLFHQAALIQQAVGANGAGEKYLQLAAEINPHYQNFHVHR